MLHAHFYRNLLAINGRVRAKKHTFTWKYAPNFVNNLLNISILNKRRYLIIVPFWITYPKWSKAQYQWKCQGNHLIAVIAISRNLLFAAKFAVYRGMPTYRKICCSSRKIHIFASYRAFISFRDKSRFIFISTIYVWFLTIWPNGTILTKWYSWANITLQCN